MDSSPVNGSDPFWPHWIPKPSPGTYAGWISEWSRRWKKTSSSQISLEATCWPNSSLRPASKARTLTIHTFPDRIGSPVIGWRHSSVRYWSVVRWHCFENTWHGTFLSQKRTSHGCRSGKISSILPAQTNSTSEPDFSSFFTNTPRKTVPNFSWPRSTHPSLHRINSMH